MAKPKAGNNGETIHSFRFSLAGLVIFSVALVAGTGRVIYRGAVGAGTGLVRCGVTDRRPKGNFFNAEPMGEPAQVDKERLARVGPWGELLTQNITLKRPPEYLARQGNDPKPETWRFEGKKPGDLKATLVAYGLTEAEAGMSARPERMVPDG